MIFTTVHSNRYTLRNAARALRSGFTLAEVLIALAIFTAAVAIMSSSGIFMTQWSISVSNYLEMNQQGRITLEAMGRDLRMASNVHTAEDNRIVIDVADRPNQVRTVEYVWDPNTGELRRIEGAASFVIIDSIDHLEFGFFDAIGNTTNRAVDVKAVEVNARLERQVRRTTNTNFLISARFTLRNKVTGT